MGNDHPGVVGVRGRSDFSRYWTLARREAPLFSNFGPPTERTTETWGGGGGGAVMGRAPRRWPG